MNVTLIDGSVGIHRGCSLASYSGEYDLIMCLVLCAALFLFKYVEDRMEAKLDESVQTAQDYSVMVDDPNGAITDPDDWKQWFSRYGQVKYVSMVRKNSALCRLLLSRHLLVRDIDEAYTREEKEEMVSLAEASTGVALHEPKLFGKNQKHAYILRLKSINEQLEAAYKLSYPVVKVFVTFEYEQEQRYCLDSLSTSYFDSAIENAPPDEDEDDVEKKYKPRIEDQTYCVLEPSEPDNLNWQMLEISNLKRLSRNFLSFCMGGAILYGSFYFTNWVQENNPSLFPLAIAAMDTLLPTIFQILLLIEIHVDEDDRQNSLLRVLFFGRILNPIVMPFLLTPWNDFVKPDVINEILQVQISTSFTSLVVQALDIPGLLDRHVNGPLFAKNQVQLNTFYAGSPWMLAERYSNVGKILFVSLLYSFITPVALYLAALAFTLIFIVDNYMLFRRWMRAPMLDPSMAVWVRRMGLIALSVHMYVTGRFIYSWPMDDTYYDEKQGGYISIDAKPPLRILDLYVRFWHDDAQRRILLIYKTATIAVFVATFIVLFGESIYENFIFLFVDSSEEKNSKVVGIPYSALKYVASYCPTIDYGTEKYLCLDTSMMKPRHFAPTFSHKVNDQVDLGLQVPPHIRHDVLSVNKYYESEFDRQKLTKAAVDESKDLSKSESRRTEVGTIRMEKLMARMREEAQLRAHHEGDANTIVEGHEKDEEVGMNGSEEGDGSGGVFSAFSIFNRKPKQSRIEPQKDLEPQLADKDVSNTKDKLMKSKEDLSSLAENDELIKRKKGKIILPPLEVDTSSAKKKLQNTDMKSKLLAKDTLSPEDFNILYKWRRELIKAECSDPKQNKRNKKSKTENSITREITDAIDFEEFLKTTEDIYTGRGIYSHRDEDLDKFLGRYDKKTRQGPSRRALIQLYAKLLRIQKEEWKVVKNMFPENAFPEDLDADSLIYGFLQTWILSSK